MNRAARLALKYGDIENAMVALAPGGIEAQEAQGQRDFVANSTLPIKCNDCKREELEGMGIVFGENADNLFVHVQLPGGWRKERTDHSMWSDLLDARGRKRASIFYKAAFYDQDAFISTTRRYSVSTRPIGGWTRDRRGEQWESVVLDCDGAVLWSLYKLRPEPVYSSATGEGNRASWLLWRREKDALSKLATGWLDKNYPDWQSVLAYWD